MLEDALLAAGKAKVLKVYFNEKQYQTT